MSDDNLIQFPKMFRGDSARSIADALSDFVKERDNARVLVIISDPDEDLLSIGWTPMDASDMLLMLKFAEYKWTNRTFGSEGNQGLYNETDD